MKKVLSMVGTRPNLVKIAGIDAILAESEAIEHVIFHSGQHHEPDLTSSFRTDLSLRGRWVQAEDRHGAPADTVARVLPRAAAVLEREQPDLVLIPGDVDSSLACAIAASRTNFPFAHIESGLRSFDREMPEEINRTLIDLIAEHHFVTEQSGIDNLERLNIDANRISFVGNTMIDSLVRNQDQAIETKEKQKPFALCTFHRPENVDRIEKLQRVIDLLKSCTKRIEVVFPVHPRTAKRLKQLDLLKSLKSIEGLTLTAPLLHSDFTQKMRAATFILTDSGGIQEETTFLKVPCLTFRTSTERPVTVEIGTNRLINSIEELESSVEEILSGQFKQGEIPPLWDGKSSERICKQIKSMLAI